MADPHLIETKAALRERMGQASDATAAKVDASLDDFSREFIGKSPFLILSTADASGRQDASPKGDGPGFVEVESDRTLLIPDRKGNKLLFGLENILENPQVGVIFLIPGCEETLRVNGRAEITADPAALARLAARGQDALVAVRVHVDEAFFHCAKAFRRSALWKPDTWQPHKVSFGAIFAAKLDKADDVSVVESIDAAIEQDYQDNL